MRFINTKRFSPVVFEGDMPFDEDYFHLKPDEINNDFLQSDDYIIDETWWNKQKQRCLEGYWVKDCIEPGGDAFVDGQDAIWNETGHDKILKQYNNLIIPNNSVYIPQYKLLIKDRSVHISGRMYFYLNFWPIYGLKEGAITKDIVNPRFLDMDFLFFRRIEMMMAEAKDGSELKARQKGFSEKGAGGVLGWNYTFVPASVNIIVAGTQPDADHTMENCIRGLDGLKNTQFYKKRAKGFDSKSVIRASNSRAEIRSLTAKDNPQTVSRFSPYWVWYEECGKWKKDLVVDTRQFVVASLIAETKKTGYQQFIGTGGDMEEGASTLEKMHYNPKDFNLLEFKNIWEREGETVTTASGHFTPAWWYAKIDEDGNSLKAKSIEYYENEKKLLKHKEQYTYTTQHPLYAADAFAINTGGFFGKEIIQCLNEQKALINTHKELQIEQIGRLEWNKKGDPMAGVHFVPDNEGFCHMFFEPEVDSDGKVYTNLYKAGTDSYDKDEAPTSDSLGSITIYKTFNPFSPLSFSNHWVARITERPSVEEGGSELFYEHTAMLCIYYGCAINLIEYSNVLIINWYRNNGFEFLLKERPEFVSASMVIKSKTVNRFGIDPNTKLQWLKMLKDHLTLENIQKMRDIDQISRFAKFRYDPTGQKYNDDVVISSALNIVLAKDEEYLEVNEEEKENKDDGYNYPVYMTVKGVLTAVYPQ